MWKAFKYTYIVCDSFNLGLFPVRKPVLWLRRLAKVMLVNGVLIKF